MTNSFRGRLAPGTAVISASAVIAASTLTPLPASPPALSHAIELAAEVVPLLPKPGPVPSLAEQIQRGIIPSLNAPFPVAPTPEPSPVTTNFADAIKNTYVAIEPWVRYGFELATYAVGWVPYVGWLSGQIMIFYNFGERIARTLVFNSADWLWGPLPFAEGVKNIAQDSWDALVQLGIDEWNYFLPPLPPLPPLPGAAQQTALPRTKALAAQREHFAPDIDVEESVSTPGVKAVANRVKPPAVHPPTAIAPAVAKSLRQPGASGPAQARQSATHAGSGVKATKPSNSGHDPDRKKSRATS